MTINEKIWNEKMHYDINGKKVKIWALSSSLIDKYKYLQVKNYYVSIKC